MIPGYTIKRLAKYALIWAGLEGVSMSGSKHFWKNPRGRGAIFTLHHVSPQRKPLWQPNAILSVTPDFLEKAIRSALECGLTPVALEDLPQRLADPLDTKRYVSFTLDDGYRDNARFAAPVFRKYNIPYTIFLTAGFVERTRTIWWETAQELVEKNENVVFDFGRGDETLELRTRFQKMIAFDRIVRFINTDDEDQAIAYLDQVAKREGIDPHAIIENLVMDAEELRELASDPLARFGAHTLTHPNLRLVDPERLEREIRLSADAVETYIGTRPRSFAYPYGIAAAVGAREVAAANRAGFDIAVTNIPGMIEERHRDHPAAYRRISLNGSYQKKRYVKALISGIPFKFLNPPRTDLP